MRTLTRPELTAAHAARQLLIERTPLHPAAAIRRLTPLQAQEPTAPYIALAARAGGFHKPQLEAAIEAGDVVKTTINRMTLHLAASDDYLAFHQLTRQARMRTWRRVYAHLDEQVVAQELGAWLREPRSNDEIRERVRAYEGVTNDPWNPILFARTLLALVQVPPAGFWRGRPRPRFIADPRPLPEPDDAAALVLERYLAAFGPASRRDVASWSGVAQRDFAAAFERIETVSYRDEQGVELLDLPGAPLPPAGTRLPVRFLSRWDQALLAYADRERIIPLEVQPLKLTLSGDQTITVEGRVAASWQLKRSARAVTVQISPHVAIPRSARAEIRAEAERTARFCEPERDDVRIEGL